MGSQEEKLSDYCLVNIFLIYVYLHSKVTIDILNNDVFLDMKNNSVASAGNITQNHRIVRLDRNN